MHVYVTILIRGEGVINLEASEGVRRKGMERGEGGVNSVIIFSF